MIFQFFQSIKKAKIWSSGNTTSLDEIARALDRAGIPYPKSDKTGKDELTEITNDFIKENKDEMDDK